MVQLAGHCSAKLKVADLIPGQGACGVVGQVPSCGACERH